MSKVRKRMPRPAMIVAVIALIAALGGSAIAGSTLTNKKFKKQALRGPVEYVSTTTQVLTTTASSATTLATCPNNTEPIGGFVRTTNASATTGFGILQDYATDTGWAAQVYAGVGGAAEPVITTAICVKVKKTEGVLTPPTG